MIFGEAQALDLKGTGMVTIPELEVRGVSPASPNGRHHQQQKGDGPLIPSFSSGSVCSVVKTIENQYSGPDLSLFLR